MLERTTVAHSKKKFVTVETSAFEKAICHLHQQLNSWVVHDVIVCVDVNSPGWVLVCVHVDGKYHVRI